ncbi:hypothetical protein BDN71DRAFT_1454714, partial [Pleurotus eryngii]
IFGPATSDAKFTPLHSSFFRLVSFSPINSVPFQSQPHRTRERGGIYSTTRIGFSNRKLSAQAQGPYFPCRESCLKHSWALQHLIRR